MVKKGDQHVVIGVVSTVTGPPVPPWSRFLELFFPKKRRNCGRNTAFCRVSEARDWIEQTLQERHAEYCHYGLDAHVPLIENIPKVVDNPTGQSCMKIYR